jgi:hypothetical protein
MINHYILVHFKVEISSIHFLAEFTNYAGCIDHFYWLKCFWQALTFCERLSHECLPHMAWRAQLQRHPFFRDMLAAKTRVERIKIPRKVLTFKMARCPNRTHPSQ